MNAFLDRAAMLCRAIAQLFLWASAVGMVAMTALVGWQVWGRYVLNVTPIAAERTTILILLYVSLLGAAVGVRERFHLGMPFIRDALPPRWRMVVDVGNHLLVGFFVAAMTWHGWLLTMATIDHRIPTVGISEGFTYLALPISGIAALLFLAEHLLNLAAGREIAPAAVTSAIE